ncbi:hypothetical protein ACFL5Z_02455, partial [Planctomycetota bacterium]
MPTPRPRAVSLPIRVRVSDLTRRPTLANVLRIWRFKPCRMVTSIEDSLYPRLSIFPDALPAFVDPEKDVITVHGRKIRPARKVYFLLNKPKGVICTNRDPQGRKKAIDLVHTPERIFCVGLNLRLLMPVTFRPTP